MRGKVSTIKVKGQEFQFFSDFIARATFAISPEGETKKIHGSGYIHNETTVRKAIKAAFSL